MSRTVRAYGWVDETGKLHLSNRKRYASDVSEKLRGKDVVLLTKVMGKRSTQQNRYYWGVVLFEIQQRLKETQGKDFDLETIHEWAKQKFNAEKVVIETTGEVLEIGGSTTEFNKEQMYEYVERIRDWAALSLDLIIPDPNTQTSFFNDLENAA